MNRSIRKVIESSAVLRPAVVLALLLVPGVAGASIPDADGVIHGCYQPKAGPNREI